jgi:pimeloyl-ACP methyl ester carboxylesterase
MKKWPTVGVLVAMVLGVTGAIYQLLSERRDLQSYPAPGELVDVGSHRLHLHCIGEGSPVVLLEAGWGNDANHWSLVQPTVAEVTKVCAYDRAGLGWSDPGPHPRTAARVVHELGRLLAVTGEEPPYLLVGHSNGGAYVRLKAAEFPEQVAGLVLIDPAVETLPCEGPRMSQRLGYGTLARLTRLGVTRLLLPRLFPLEGSALPAEQREVHGALRARTGAWAAFFSEGMETCRMLDSLRATERPDPDIPVVVVAADRRAPEEQVFVEALQEVALHLGAEEVTVAEESGHWVQLDRPDVVIDAILSQVEAIRAPIDW